MKTENDFPERTGTMDKKYLTFNKNNKFKILVASDLHYISRFESLSDKNKAEDTLLLLDASIKALNPDLVVFLGDNALGETPDELKKSVEDILKTVNHYNKPFCFVMGEAEHNMEHNGISPEMITDIYRRYDNCLMTAGKKNITGTGNYNIPIKDNEGKIRFNLWFTDSNGASPDRSKSFITDWVHEDQIEWYEKEAEALKQKNGKKAVPAILFQHIPVPEIYGLFRNAKASEKADAVRGIGVNTDKCYVPSQPLAGDFNEAPECPEYNSGQFESWKKTGDIKAAFFGHNHTNDFEGSLDGILLAQCKATGFCSYHDGDKTGVKLITVSGDTLEVDTKNYYFGDFALKSKSNVKIREKLTVSRKRKIKKQAILGAGVAAVSAVITAVSLRKGKKK